MVSARIESVVPRVSSQRFFTPWRLACMAVVVIAALPYLPAMQGQRIWDDYVLISGSGIGGGRSLLACFCRPFLEYYYRPLVSVSFFLDHRIWGQTPFGYHQTNILIHLLTTAALVGLLLAAFRRRSIALLGGLLFALQPAQVSTVAWIGGRTDSLCALFLTLFGWSLVLAVRSEERERTRLLAASAVAFACAVFTKEQSMAAMPLVPLAFYCFGNRQQSSRSSWRQMLWASIPFVATCVLYAIIWVVLGPPRPAAVPKSLFSLLEQGGQTLACYTLLLVFPAPRWMHTFCLGLFQRHALVTAVAGFAAGGGLIAFFFWSLWRRPAAAWFAALIGLTILPVSNFLPLPSLLVAPYRVGIAGIGAAALLAWALMGAADQRKRALPVAPWRIAAAAGLALWYGALTVWGTVQWRDSSTLFATIVRYDPYSIIARMNLTSALLSAHKTRPAIRHLEIVLSQLYGSNAWRTPKAAASSLHRDPEILRRIQENQGNRIAAEQWLSQLYSQLGFALLQDHQLKRAKRIFLCSQAVSPDNAGANEGLGSCAFQAKHYAEAIRHLGRAVQQYDADKVDRTDLHSVLGRAHAALGQWREAADEFRTCTEKQQWVGLAYEELAKAQIHLGDRAGAITTLQAALSKAPGNRDMMAQLATLKKPGPSDPASAPAP